MGDKVKRTFKLTEDGNKIADWVRHNDDIPLDKSEFVDRAIKYYWREMERGTLDDPLVTSSMDLSEEIEIEEDTDGKGSFLSNMRDKL